MIYCSIDVETTGLDERKHEIWDIAFVTFEWGTFKEGPRFLSEMKPMHLEQADDYALQMAGKPLNQINIKPSQVRAFFLEWKKDLFPDTKFIPVGWNYPFDERFIKNWLPVDLYNEHFFYKSVDIYQRVLFLKEYGYEPFANIKSLGLENVARELGLKGIAHTSYGDASNVIKVVEKIHNAFKHKL